MNPKDTLSAVFSSLIKEVNAYFGLEAIEEELNSREDSEAFVGNFELSHDDGSLIQVQIEQENFSEWQALRLRVTFGFSPEEKEWVKELHFLEAFLLSRVLPGTFFPIAPTLLPEGEYELQSVIPFDDQSKERILSFILFGSSFYKEMRAAVCELGFTEELRISLRAVEYHADTLWTLGLWERFKKTIANAEETYSLKSNYYRLIPATEETAGMIAVNLGSAIDVGGSEERLVMFLAMNAISFFSDNYFVAVDDRCGLILLAFLPPAKEEEGKKLVNQLLERAATVGGFVRKIVSDHNELLIRKACDNPAGFDQIIFT